MTYLAPRQGLFAIILLVSFCLQTLLLVISTDQQLTNSRAQKGEQMVAQLIDEARLSLENKDRVSLSVIANRYTSEQDVTRILIKDNNGDILVPVGNAPMQQGDTITQIATKGDAVIGSVALTLKDISKGEIIAMQWPFVIGSMLLHLLLWLIYGYIARPTREQINALSRDIQDLHREQYRPIDQREFERGYERDFARGDETETESPSTDFDSATSGTMSDANNKNPNTRKLDLPRKLDIHSAVNQYVRGQQGQNSELDATHDTTDNDTSNAGTDSRQDKVAAANANLNSDSHKSNSAVGTFLLR